jgi:O-antigen ligase
MFLGVLTSYMFVFLCFAYPISAITSSILGLPSTYVNVLYRAINLFIALYVIFISICSNKITISKYSIPLICFFVLYFFRIFWDTIIAAIKTEQSLIEIYSFYVGSIIFPVAAILIAFKFTDIRKTFFLMFYVLAIANGLMLFFYFSQSGWAISPEMLMSRAEIKGVNEELLIINPISFGLYGGYLVLLCFSFLLILKDFIPKGHFKFIYVFMFLGFINLILGTSRGPFLFSFFAIILILFFHFSYEKLTFKYTIKLAVVFITTVFVFTTIYLEASKKGIEIGILERLLNTKESIQSGEKEGRNELYEEGIMMFKQSPIIGHKIVLDSTSSYPHNAIVEVLMGTGIIGLVFYLSILISLLIKFIFFKSYSKYFCVLICLFILSYGISLTTGNLYQSVDNWNLIAVLLCFSKGVRSDIII